MKGVSAVLLNIPEELIHGDITVYSDTTVRPTCDV
jgi:hypothetical protein